jgi:hypothetical protein
MTPGQKQERILRQGLALRRIFPDASIKGPVSLYARLHQLEAEAQRLAELECNEPLPEGYAEKKEASIKRRLGRVLGVTDVPVFLNGDPRGYALKIDDVWMREHRDLAEGLATDWGGYGILAPDVTP